MGFRRWRRSGLAAWVSLWLSACGGGGMGPLDGGCEVMGQPGLTLGTGETAFEPVQDGQSLQLVAGSQGGFHVWLSMQARGVCPGRYTVTLTVAPEGNAPASTSRVTMSFDEAQGTMPGVVQEIGWPARVLDPWCAVGQPVDLVVDVDTGGPQPLHAELAVVPTAPKGGFPTACGAP